MAKQSDEKLWLVLVGAAIASKAVRERATKTLETSDAPESLRGMWEALRDGDGKAARSALQAWGIAPVGKTVIDSLVNAVQERAYEAASRFAIVQVQHLKGIAADDALAILERLAGEIRAKKTALELNVEKPTRAE